MAREEVPQHNVSSQDYPQRGRAQGEYEYEFDVLWCLTRFPAFPLSLTHRLRKNDVSLAFATLDTLLTSLCGALGSVSVFTFDL